MAVKEIKGVYLGEPVSIIIEVSNEMLAKRGSGIFEELLDARIFSVKCKEPDDLDRFKKGNSGKVFW